MAKGEKNNCLTLNGVLYKTTGNIIFSDCEEGDYFIAESSLLDKIDKAIQDGILENGMGALVRKLKT